MNKRIKKKNDIKRFDEFFFKAENLVTTLDYYFKHSHYDFFLHCIHCLDLFDFDIYWEEYDKWIGSTNGKRYWSYVRKKNNIPKYLGYKNKVIKYK